MAMTVGNDTSGEAEEEVISAINTTPLVDVMLVLLIIFLITIPVVTQTIAMSLPKETNIARQTKPENIEISVSKDGDVFWNAQFVPDNEALFQRLSKVAVMNPQPELHIRGDARADYDAVGRVVLAAQQAGIARIGFLTEPPGR